MKIKNIIRTQAVGISFVAAMLLSATPAHSQEITNTEFSDGPYVTAYAQPTPTTQAQAVQLTTQAPAAMVATPALA